jgi:biopolymer transport protein ExbD
VGVAEAAAIVDALARLRRGASERPAPRDESLDRRLREAQAKRRARRGLSLNLTPMIDVTFLLLVFFVCTTKALDKQALLRADLSERGGTGVAADALALDEPPLRIELVREGGATRYRVLAPMPQPGDAVELGAMLATRRYGPGNPTGLFAAEQPIELAPAREVPWEEAVAAFNAVTRAGYTRISFARPR